MRPNGIHTDLTVLINVTDWKRWIETKHRSVRGSNVVWQIFSIECGMECPEPPADNPVEISAAEPSGLCSGVGTFGYLNVELHIRWHRVLTMDSGDQLTDDFVIIGLSPIAVRVGRENQRHVTILRGEDASGRNVIPVLFDFFRKDVAAQIAEGQLLNAAKVVLCRKLRHGTKLNVCILGRSGTASGTLL
jgi:hypothetical protein